MIKLSKCIYYKSQKLAAQMTSQYKSLLVLGFPGMNVNDGVTFCPYQPHVCHIWQGLLLLLTSEVSSERHRSYSGGFLGRVNIFSKRLKT